MPRRTSPREPLHAGLVIIMPPVLPVGRREPSGSAAVNTPYSLSGLNASRAREPSAAPKFHNVCYANGYSTAARTF